MVGILSETEIEDVLKNNIIGRIGCRDGDKVYVVPISYVHMNDYVLCHSFSGKKIDMMRKNPSVCFEVDEIKSYTDWRCVIAHGRYEELTDENDITEAKRQFTDLMMHIKISETALSPEERQNHSSPAGPRMASSIFYIIRFSRITGRCER